MIWEITYTRMGERLPRQATAHGDTEILAMMDFHKKFTNCFIRAIWKKNDTGQPSMMPLFQQNVTT
jgi:hypothetical protein